MFSLSFSQKYIFLIRPTDSITIITNHLFKPVLKGEFLSFHIFHNTSYFSMHYNLAVIMHIKHLPKTFEYIVNSFVYAIGYFPF